MRLKDADALGDDALAGFEFVCFFLVTVAFFGGFFFLTDEDESDFAVDDDVDSSGSTGFFTSTFFMIASEVMEFGPMLEDGVLLLDEAITSLMDKNRAEAPINLETLFIVALFC
jgi:hypothetical protein